MMTYPPGPPAPPPGPGVQVPFAAPPGERDRRRLWIGLGLGGALLAICCVGGIVGVGALVVQSSRDLLNRATTVVDDYLGALHNLDYPTAYDKLCANLQGQVSLSQFQTTQEQLSRVISYSLGQPRGQGSAIWIEAEVVREAGPESSDFKLVQEGRTTTSLKICTIRS